MMFAKPANPGKKPTVPAKAKSQPMGKIKTLGTKTGVKTQQPKKGKPSDKGSKPKPATRVEAGYSLYSTDPEDQISETYKDVELCEKILTHLKHKQKGKQKGKSPKKPGSPPKPKALNDITSSPARTFTPAYNNASSRCRRSVNSVDSDPTAPPQSGQDYGFPYGASAYLHQYPPSEISQTSNPVFNLRLSSSTPDPDKRLSNPAQGMKLPGNTDPNAQEVPERDISSVSSIPPSLSHLKNMADMVDIYKQLEAKKLQQIQEETAFMQTEKVADTNGNLVNLNQLRWTVEQQRTQQKSQNSEAENMQKENQSVPMTGTGSLGFVPSHSQTGFQPIQSSSSESQVLPMFSPFQPVLQPVPAFTQSQEDPRRESSVMAFQPYLSRDSLGFQPPQTWLKENVSPQILLESQQIHQPQPMLGTLPLAQEPAHKPQQGQETEEPLSGRSEKSGTTNDTSRGTEYVPLPIPDGTSTGDTIPKSGNPNIAFEKQNGLYQIHRKPDEANAVSPLKINLDRSGSSKSGSSGKTPVKGPTKSQNQQDKPIGVQNAYIHEAPERDIPQITPAKPSEGSHTFTVDLQTSQSQNVSEVTTSTPRDTNHSGAGSGDSSHGNIVFIPTPNDSNTQNMIGYIPGIPIVPGSNQPITVPLAYGLHPSQVAQLANQSAGSAASQVTGGNQGQPAQQNVSGSSHPSAAYAQAVAAGDIGVRKLRYLLKELGECTKVSKDNEASRLVNEINTVIDSIPQLGVTFNLQTEVDLALQPLRSENSQLRRKLRLINQQLKDKEIAGESKDINFEILQLQTSNEVLQKTIKEEKEIKTRLAAEVQFLMDQIHKMKVERSKMISEISEKETEQLKVRQETLVETQKLRHDLDMMKRDQESTVNKLESLEQENHILQITLQQRDTEIERQQEVLDTMKESIGELLHELDQTRSGDKTWDQNQSFGLNKLMKIIEEESCVAPDDKQSQTQRKVVRSPERKKLPFTASENSVDVTPRLTRAALARHNYHDPSPPRRQGPASESELNTLIEMESNYRRKSPAREAGSHPKHRRTSSSSPIRLKNGCADSFGHNRTSSTPMKKPDDSRKEDLTRFRFDRYRKETQSTSNVASAQGRPPLKTANRNDDRHSEDLPSEISVEQSRYSVTDYFNRYHPSQPGGAAESRSRPPYGRNLDRKEMYEPEYSDGRRGKKSEAANNIDDRTLQNHDSRSRNIKQLTLFKGTNYDTTISAIHDDDNVSSVSMNSVSTANTADDRRFRNGIATLDANIARLQKALQKTKSMLT